MSNAKPPEDKNEDALAALHGLEPENEADGEEEEEGERPAGLVDDGGASASASGFVGMLAKEGASAAPSPRAGGSNPQEDSGSGEVPLKKRPEIIHMAREIQPVAREAPKRAQKEVPGWYHIAVPAMFTLGFILFFIGVWAIGALIYMGMSKPAAPVDVGYPLIEWRFDESGDAGAFTAASKIMAVSMLICIPLSIAMCLMSGLMRKQIRLAERLAGR